MSVNEVKSTADPTPEALAARRAFIVKELEGSCALENGFKVPDTPERYLVIEKTSGERVWAENCSTLPEAAIAINDSSTDREEVFILDLDAKDSDATQLIPVLEVTRIFGKYVDLYTTPASAAILPPSC
jgi:hypothetical protein